MTNCPPIYRNIQCESFGNRRKITSQMLRQFCKNDAYLKEQIDLLWDATDPESRKRFYPPDYMDIEHSFGIEEYKLDKYEREFFDYWDTVYRFSTVDRYVYQFDFDTTNDRVSEITQDADVNVMNVWADSLLDLENDYGVNKLCIVREPVTVDGKVQTISTLRPPLTTTTFRDTFYTKADVIPFQDKKLVEKAKKGKPYKPATYIIKDEKLGKAKRDAYFKGADGKWDCNNHWYNGFDENKNYHVKSKWKKDPYGEDKKIVKKYGRIPSVCHAQTFKAKHSGRITKVNLNIHGDKSAPSPCTVEIRTVDKKTGKPTEKVLARTVKKFNSKGENIVSFTFKKEMAKVKKGKHYAIVVRSPFSHFAKGYRWGGWTYGCFSSPSKYYGHGSAFTSKNNGHTWVKNGKSDIKGYKGAHYYEWGSHQAPVDFGFEVFVAPITRKASKKLKRKEQKAVAGKRARYTCFPNSKIIHRAYSEIFTWEYTYYKAGSYYLYLKPIRCNPIDYFQVNTKYVLDGVEVEDNQYWVWEYYDSSISEWVEFGSGIVDLDNNRTNFTVLKLRVRCDVTQNTMGEVVQKQYNTNGTPYLPRTTDEKVFKNLLNKNKLAQHGISFAKSITLTIGCKRPSKAYLRTHYYIPPKTDMLGASIWSEVNATAQTIGAGNVEVDIIHERSDVEHFMLYNLSIIAGMDINSGETYSNKQYQIFNRISEYISLFDEGNEFTTAQEIIDYIINDKDNNNSEFLKFMMNQTVPVYILPIPRENTGGDIEYDSMFDYIKLPSLPSYPLIAGDIGEEDIDIPIGRDDDGNDISRFIGVSDYGFVFKLGGSIKSTISRIIVTYMTQLMVDFGVENETTEIELIDEETGLATGETSEDEINSDDEGFETDGEETEEHIEETLIGITMWEQYDRGKNFVTQFLTPPSGNELGVQNYMFKTKDSNGNYTGNPDSSIDYALSYCGKYIVFNSWSPVVRTIFPNLYTARDVSGNVVVGNGDVASVELNQDYNFDPNPMLVDGNPSVSDYHLKVDLKSKTLEEFIDFEVDYDEGELRFYDQMDLINGEFTLTYNPLWARGLSVADFPLKLDLWKEKYIIESNNDGENGIYKLKLNMNTGNYENDKFFKQTSVNPLTKDSISSEKYYTFKTSVSPRDNIRKLVINEGTNDEKALIEDSQFFVDYLSNTVTLYVSDLNVGDTLTIHYTPNLTDNGLALGYRLTRPRYYGGDTIDSEADERYLSAQPNKDDDVYVGMNYFTYRT